MDDEFEAINIADERLVSAEHSENEEDEKIEVNLRPSSLSDFVGQEQIKKQLLISIEAAKQRDEPIEHVLLYGNPGLGKTTLAHIISHEMNANIKVTAGPALERVGDLAAILSNLERGDVLFIDEIHRMNKTIEEVLYSAMEDYALDIIVGKGPAARTLRMPLEKFTIIGATTKMNLLSGPLRDRFGHVFHLNFYEHSDIDKIINRNAEILSVIMEPGISFKVAERSRRTPRVANRLLKRVRDYAQVKNNGKIDESVIRASFEMLGIDNYGLDHVDRKILSAIIEKFKGGPVGLGTLSASVAEDIETMETIYEPYLLQIGMIDRTPRGRVATHIAKKHLGNSVSTLF